MARKLKGKEAGKKAGKKEDRRQGSRQRGVNCIVSRERGEWGMHSEGQHDNHQGS